MNHPVISSLHVGVLLIFTGLGQGFARCAESQEPMGQWNGFRGPDVTGISRETWAIDERLNLGLAVTWKSEIGSAYSGIAVAGGKAITMYASGESDVVAAFDVDNGRLVWSYVIDETYAGHDGSHDGPISTPLVNGGRVFGLAPRGQLFALDLGSGEKIWSTDLVADHGIEEPAWGFGASPIFEDGVLIIGLGGAEAAIGGFDPATGQRLWAAGSDTASYQTPVPITLDRRRQIVAAGDTLLFGLDSKSGEVLWQYPHEGHGGAGALSLVPVSAGERQLLLAHRVEESVMIRLSRGRDAGVTSVWQSPAIRNSYNVPVYHEGYLYAFSSRFLTCVDAVTGESRWRSRRPGDGFLILVDGRLVIVTKTGGVHIVQATPAGYVESAGRAIFDDPVWSFPSFAGGSIYVRSLNEIARVDLETGVDPGKEQVVARRFQSSSFGNFLAAVEAANATQKKALVDRFMAAQESFPILEGDNRVHFVYRGDAADVALAGEMFGARHEESMIRLPGTDFFYYSLELEADARLNYVLIEDFEEILDPLNPRRTTTSVLTRDMEISISGAEYEMSWFAMPKWRAPSHLAGAPGAPPGRLEHPRLESGILGGEIELDVYLPRGYSAADDRRYPVAYVHGGPSSRERSRIPESLDHLVGKTVQPVIVVFVALPSLDAFVDEVVPFIDGRYRTLATPAGRANIGQAWTSFPALLLTLDRRDLFGKIGLQSLFLFTRMEKVLEPLLENIGDNPPEIYMDWGTYDLRSTHEPWGMVAKSRELAARLRSEGVELAGGEVHDGTGWSSWRQRTDLMFETLFPLR